MEKVNSQENNSRFDYYYGTEADQFSFYRVPRMLIKDKRFSKLSSDAKLLYGLMLDRMSLSMKNQWLDKENRAYIIYRVEEVADDLGVCRETAIKIMAELDSKKGIGLIEKKKMGLGRPDIIYVKNFVGAEIGEKKESTKTVNITEVEKFNFKDSEKPTSRSEKNPIQEMDNINFKRSDNSTSMGGEKPLQAVEKVDSNYINNNYTENNYNNLIYLSKRSSEVEEGLDGNTQYALYEKIIKESIEYDYLLTDNSLRQDELREIVDLVVEIVAVERETVRINGTDYPYQVVKGKFLKLNMSHIQYVIDCMQNNTTKIGNMRSYLLTALFNAPNTMSNYYRSEVAYDMYGRF